MKQAILITAYHQIELLRKIVSLFDEDFDIYIHIDKKCKEDYSGIANDHVFVFSKYRIYWGSEYHLFAIMDLVKAAHARGPYSYYHLITGNDYPIKPLAVFKSFFSEENKTNYIEYHKLPRDTWPNEGGIGRVRYFWIGNQWKDVRDHNKLTNLLLKVQRKLGITRKFVKRYYVLYGGGTYWSLTQEAIDVLICHVKELNLLRYTHCAEEIFFHTLLLNSEIASKVNSNSLRFILWKDNASSPEILTSDSIDDIYASSDFFVRKIVLPESETLLHQISELWKKS